MYRNYTCRLSPIGVPSAFLALYLRFKRLLCVSLSPCMSYDDV
ncbi:hypothetical protein HMPREF0663_10966 [Hoylesella oralis ATCC 33269]|uniref:Uncharacterized protein n=1 Tax=Hoylesella oralis ATCC 33269 TaxID=873533 RepID=E7RP65_9BACT|nr:hypothetical protein [Hoylesella oralis]EFZ37508.1 hypothetical protein HMPREF0663_10966 [Hoylesella oralis ATCC 33269]